MDQLRARCISQILRQLFAGLLDHVQLSVIIDRFYVFLFCFWGVSAFRVHLQFLLCLRSNNYHYLSDRRMIIKLVSVLIMQFLLVSCQQQSSALHIKGCDMKLAKQLLLSQHGHMEGFVFLSLHLMVTFFKSIFSFVLYLNA